MGHFDIKYLLARLLSGVLCGRERSRMRRARMPVFASIRTQFVQLPEAGFFFYYA